MVSQIVDIDARHGEYSVGGNYRLLSYSNVSMTNSPLIDYFHIVVSVSTEGHTSPVRARLDKTDTWIRVLSQHVSVQGHMDRWNRPGQVGYASVGLEWRRY